MKKQIIMIMMFIFIISITQAANLEIDIITDEDITTDLTEIADGDITNNIYCEAGEDCITNLLGGELNPGNNNIINQYLAVTQSGTGIRKLMEKISYEVVNYIEGNLPTFKGDAWNFWELLDMVFVSHKEYEPTFNNVMFLADEVDVLKAENEILRKYLNITLNPDLLECQIGINKAKRVGTKITTENGFMIDIEAFGETCIRIE